MIKLYPGGRFSGPATGSLAVGDRLDVIGPYGVFTLRDSAPRPGVHRRRRRAWRRSSSLLRSLAESGSSREATYYYGARAAATCASSEELDALARRCRTSPSSPRSPSPTTRPGTGEAGLITDVVQAARGRPLRGRRLRLRSAADGRGGDRAARAPGRARGAHLLRQVHDHRRRGRRDPDREPTQRHGETGHDRTRSAASRSRSFTDAEAGRQGVPRLDARAATTTSPRRSASRPHYEDVTVDVQPDPAALPHPGLDLRLRRRRGGYPQEWTALKSWGSDRPSRSGSRARVARATSGRPPAGTSSSTPTRSGSRRSTATTPTSCGRSTRTSRRPGRPRRSRSGTATGCTFVERHVGAWTHAEHGLGMHVLRQRPAPGADEHDQQRDLGEQHAQAPLRPGPGPLQPDAVRGDRGLRRRRAHGDLARATRSGRARARSSRS